MTFNFYALARLCIGKSLFTNEDCSLFICMDGIHSESVKIDPYYRFYNLCYNFL
jgi:hypothetical protein